jgi:hypothetical protein
LCPLSSGGKAVEKAINTLFTGSIGIQGTNGVTLRVAIEKVMNS